MQETEDNGRYPAGHAIRFARDEGSALVRLLAGFLVVLAFPLWTERPGLLKAQQACCLASAQLGQSELNSPISTRKDDSPENRTHSLSDSPVRGYIEESIPQKYKGRYRKWKKQFLATEAGRQQWEVYEHHPTLILTITISKDATTGAKTGKFNWDESGNLTTATITLGSNIDSGYPCPDFYPVLNSLKRLDACVAFDASILAAAKIAHEFEHINQASAAGLGFRATNEMMVTYNRLFLENRYNVRDPKLLEMATKMGGTPLEIREDREHRAEIRAMRYLLERLTDNCLRRALFVSIKETISFFAKSFQRRYAEFIHAQGLPVKELALTAN